MNQWRCWSLFLGLSFGSAACTKENPAYHCQNSTCIDPAFPYCDADGSIGGTAGVCIAVTCTAGEFGKCSGDSALTCNDTGTGYVETQCAHGCDEGTGCRICEANQTVCQNGVVAVCDASGVQTSATSCPLGCFEDQPRCRDIDASNTLSQYADMVPDPPDIDLEDAYFHVDTGEVTNHIDTPVTVPSFAVPAPNGGAPIRVFVVNKARIASANIIGYGASGVSPYQAAFALVARGDVTITGPINVSGLVGSVTLPGCDGGNGQLSEAGGIVSSGGGGGGNATDGARGGAVTGHVVGGTYGAAIGHDSLVPLRGGCQGGTDVYAGTSNILDYPTLGGGAFQISSGTRISIEGAINANGSPGRILPYQPTGYTIGGGGGGGAILLEAPSVSLGTAAKLSVQGGDGAEACTVASAMCALGGNGAKLGGVATAGFDLAFAGYDFLTAGGGGGGWGRIRVNTADGTYTTSSTSIEDGVVTAGTLHTR